jgi:hypothetical protein
MVQRLPDLLPMRNAIHRANVFGHVIGKKHRRRADTVDVVVLMISKKLLGIIDLQQSKEGLLHHGVSCRISVLLGLSPVLLDSFVASGAQPECRRFFAALSVRG